MMDPEENMNDAQRNRDRIVSDIKQWKKAHEHGYPFRQKATPIDADPTIGNCCRIENALQKEVTFALAKYEAGLAVLEEQLRNAEVTLREAAMAFGQTSAPSV